MNRNKILLLVFALAGSFLSALSSNGDLTKVNAEDSLYSKTFSAAEIYDSFKTKSDVTVDLSNDQSYVILSSTFKLNAYNNVDPYIYFNESITYYADIFDRIELNCKLSNNVNNSFNFYMFQSGNPDHVSSQEVSYGQQDGEFHNVVSPLPHTENEPTQFRLDVFTKNAPTDLYLKSMRFYNNDGSAAKLRPSLYEEYEQGKVRVKPVAGNIETLTKDNSPSGANGSTLKLTNNTAAEITIDFTPSNLIIDDLEELIIPVYTTGVSSDNKPRYPEFRIRNPITGNWGFFGTGVFYGDGGYSLSTVPNQWHEIHISLNWVDYSSDGKHLGKMTIQFRCNNATDAIYFGQVSSNVANRKIIPYTQVAEGWNHVASTTLNGYQTVFVFGITFEDTFGNGADSSNRATATSDCGKNVTINGKSLYSLGAKLTYAHGYNYVHLDAPSIAYLPSNGYKVTTLHFPEGTVFGTNKLGEATLYLVHNQWTKVKPDTVEEIDSFYTISDLFDDEKITLEENVLIKQTYKTITDGDYLQFILELTENEQIIIIYFGDNLTINITPNKTEIYVASSLKSTCLDKNTLNSNILITVHFKSNSEFEIALNNLYICKYSGSPVFNFGKDLSISFVSNISTTFSSLGGSDYISPFIDYYGADTICRTEGDSKIDFANLFEIFDNNEGYITDRASIIYSDGAIKDDKLVKGNHKINICVSDNDGNKAKKTINLLVYGVDESVNVTFDNQNSQVYKIGDYIVKPADPIKEPNPFASYAFDGWFNGDIKWDFENFVLTEDVDLVSKFTEAPKEYLVEIDFEGFDLDDLSLRMKYDSQIDLTQFDVNGYESKYYVDNILVTNSMVTIKKDTEIKVVLKNTSTDNESHVNPVDNNKPKNDSKFGCFGDLLTTSLFISGLSLFGLALAAKSKKEDR